MKYLGLRFFAFLIMIVGFCMCVPGIIVLVGVYQSGQFNVNAPSDLLVVGLAALASLLGLPFIAFGELLNVAVAIERNTSKVAALLKDEFEKTPVAA